jgi:hypothetical protein
MQYRNNKKRSVATKQPSQDKYRASKLSLKASIPPEAPLRDLEAYKRVEVFNPDNLSITSEFIDEVLIWGPSFSNNRADALDNVRTALTTAKKLKSTLERGKNELEAIKKAVATKSQGMTNKGILFWDGVDDDSKDLLPETYALVQKLEETLAQETERLSRALDVEVVIEALERRSCIYSGLSTGPVNITELVQETGLSFEVITTIASDLGEVIFQEKGGDHLYLN